MNAKTIYLKLQDVIVLKIDYENAEYSVFRADLLPFSLRDSVIDNTDIEDPKEKFKIASLNQDRFNQFLSARSLSVNRENAKFILNELGISQKSDYETKIKIMLMCKALSAADDYWITTNENDLWANNNVRENPLHETLSQIALFGKSLTITGKIITPELTGQGAYAKAWFRENGVLYLYKAGTHNGNEPQREAMASRIMGCFNVPHVDYTLTEKDGRITTKCRQMNTSDYSIVDAGEINAWCSKTGKNFHSLVIKTDAEMFYKTIVMDYLCANRDRHDGNWGFYMDNSNGSLVRMHPLFDHNNCFDKDFMEDPTGGKCQLIPGKNQREAALYAIKKCTVRCIKPVTRDMFIDKMSYLTFMKRAEELGLYRKEKISIFSIFGNMEKYVPVKLERDDTSDYYRNLFSKQENSLKTNKKISVNIRSHSVLNVKHKKNRRNISHNSEMEL